MTKQFKSDINPDYYITVKGYRDADPDINIQIVEQDEIVGAVEFQSECKAREFLEAVEAAIELAWGS